MKFKKSTIYSWAKFFIGWPLSFVALFFILKLVLDRKDEITPYLHTINYFHLLVGVVLFYIYYLLRSYLWLTLLKINSYSPSFKENTYRFGFSELKRYVPGNIWSFMSRASMFSELGIDKKTLGISLLADIQLVIIGCGLVSLLSIPWLLDSPEALKAQLDRLLPISALVIAGYFAAIAWFYKRKYNRQGSIISNLLLPGFPNNSKPKIITLSVFAYFIFGVANFMVLQSVLPQAINSAVELSSFFTFSLLLGYLSFITPMGLGVREAVVTLGLSKIMPATLGGFVAIFSRIILILSELSFLLFVFLWVKMLRKK